MKGMLEMYLSINTIEEDFDLQPTLTKRIRLIKEIKDFTSVDGTMIVFPIGFELDVIFKNDSRKYSGYWCKILPPNKQLLVYEDECEVIETCDLKELMNNKKKFKIISKWSYKQIETLAKDFKIPSYKKIDEVINGHNEL